MPPTPWRLHCDDRLVLTLDGVVCGEVMAAEGGDVSAPVIREPDASGFVRKHLGPSAPNPIELTLDLSLKPAVYEWINASWQGQISHKDGTLISLDPNLRSKGELIFERAVIGATAFPPVDAATRDRGRLVVTLQPERTTFAPSSGQPVQTPAPQRQRYWRVSNFRLRVDPLDCRRVTKVEAGVITRSSNGLDFPDLTITLSEAGSDQWDAWHQEFVERGQNDAGHEKAGTLTFLAPDMNTELGSVKLGGLGLYRLAPETTTTQSGDMIRRLVAELYCQRMELSVAAHSWP